MRRPTNTALALLAFTSSSLAQNVTTQIKLVKDNIVAGEDIVVRIQNATTDLWPGTDQPIHKHFHFGITNSMTGVRMCTLRADKGLIPASPNSNTTDPLYKAISPTEGEINLGPFPAEIGPSGAYYTIIMSGFTNTNNSEDYKLRNADISNPGLFHSPYFHADEMKGRFTPLEEPSLYMFGDRQIALFTEIPCESYRCAQRCAAKQFPVKPRAWSRNSTWANCVEKCEGVWVNWEFIDEMGAAGELEWFGDVPEDRFLWEEDEKFLGEKGFYKGECPGCEGFGKTQCAPAGCCGEGEYCWRYNRCVNTTVGFQQEWVDGTGTKVEDRIHGSVEICEVEKKDEGQDQEGEKEGVANFVGVDRGLWALVAVGLVTVGSVWC